MGNYIYVGECWDIRRKTILKKKTVCFRWIESDDCYVIGCWRQSCNKVVSNVQKSFFTYYYPRLSSSSTASKHIGFWCSTSCPGGFDRAVRNTTLCLHPELLQKYPHNKKLEPTKTFKFYHWVEKKAATLSLFKFAFLIMQLRANCNVEKRSGTRACKAATPLYFVESSRSNNVLRAGDWKGRMDMDLKNVVCL